MTTSDSEVPTPASTKMPPQASATLANTSVPAQASLTPTPISSAPEIKLLVASLSDSANRN